MADAHYTALLIGNSLYPDDPHNLPELKGPVNDLPLLREALTDPEVGMFEPGSVLMLPERSKREITTAMEQFFQGATRDSLVVLYYSGHGRRDEYDNLYLCARDTRTDLLMSTGISDSDVNGMMRACPARTFVVMLDCCYSGSFKGGGLPATLRGAGRFLITSSRHGQLSSDSSEPSGASAFTHHLVEALKSGSLDSDRDGFVSLTNVYDYVHRMLQEDTRQIPERHFDHAVGDVAMSRSRTSRPADLPEPSPARPELAVSETSIEIANVQPGERLPPEMVDVFNLGGGRLDWVAEADADWIRVETSDTYVRLWLDPRPGNNRGNVRVRDRRTGDTRTIRVRVEVLAQERPPHLELSTDRIDFGELRVGVASPSRSVRLINTGGGALEAEVTTTHPAICARSLGDTVDVVVNTRAAAEIDGAVNVRSTGGQAPVRVTASVRTGPVLQVDVDRLDFGRIRSGERPVQVIRVANAGDGALNWHYRPTGDFGTVERRAEGLAVQVTKSAIGRVRGEVLVLSDGGQAVVEVRADVVRGTAGRRRPLALVGLAAAAIVVGSVAAVLAVLAGRNGGPLRPTPSNESTVGAISVPHVYGFTEAAGGQSLRDAGFRVRSISVCSGSVGRDHVRQVLTDVGAGEGRIVDDQGGGGAATPGTSLVMKISTGPCALTSPPTPRAVSPSPPSAAPRSTDSSKITSPKP